MNRLNFFAQLFRVVSMQKKAEPHHADTSQPASYSAAYNEDKSQPVSYSVVSPWSKSTLFPMCGIGKISQESFLPVPPRQDNKWIRV